MSHETEVATVGLTKRVAESIATITAFAHARSGRTLAREQDKDRVPSEVEVVSDEEFVRRVDGVVTLGGDGTMCRLGRSDGRRPAIRVLPLRRGSSSACSICRCAGTSCSN